MYLQKRDLYVFVGVFFREMNLKFGLITPKILRGGTNKQKKQLMQQVYPSLCY
jgi:hypothetical protein